MSSGLHCEFIEASPGEWFYLLELETAPRGAPDWREYAEAFGPFASYGEAEDHLCAHHRNPGGHVIIRYEEGYEPSETVRLLLNEAVAATCRRSLMSARPMRELGVASSACRR
jgi:hypothetical protein